MKKDKRIYLYDILTAIGKIESYTKYKTLQDFLSNDMMQHAVIRLFEIIGEASRRLDDNFIKKYPEFPLKKAISMRNLLIHEYDEINLDIIWDTIKHDLPKLKVVVEGILNKI